MNMIRQQTDADLMLSLQKDDSSAFTAIYQRYWKQLLAIAYQHCKDKMLAEEMVQEVFVSVWKRRKVLVVANLQAYLATAVRLSVFKHYLRQQRRSAITLQVADARPHGWEEERIYAKFLQQQIIGIMESLPAKCRLVFRLSRLEGMSIREVAREIGVAEKTVEAHLTKALKVLREQLNRSLLF